MAPKQMIGALFTRTSAPAGVAPLPGARPEQRAAPYTAAPRVPTSPVSVAQQHGATPLPARGVVQPAPPARPQDRPGADWGRRAPRDGGIHDDTAWNARTGGLAERGVHYGPAVVFAPPPVSTVREVPIVVRMSIVDLAAAYSPADLDAAARLAAARQGVAAAPPSAHADSLEALYKEWGM